MTFSRLYSAALYALPLLASACQSDADKPTGLKGHWQLTKLECFCPPNTPTPNEAIEFDGAGNVREYTDGKVTHSTTYQLSTGSTGCAANANLVTINYAPNTITASYTITDNVLVLDRGLCLDAPRKTYTYVGATGQK
ncbi:hypothetical protein [Hymenobacter sp. CRA2]|uniref:hypothetical protein n=1 Tax=Hymenobacter sp. CRA2 TaxID=1955620 RepID=UPI00098E9A10|nr:hypothetical protein [Hymenobacter sp. CRA2]OON68710.1 hypothetical protein B0919_10985 [Hymenobacter sp. CRA2]